MGLVKKGILLVLVAASAVAGEQVKTRPVVLPFTAEASLAFVKLMVSSRKALPELKFKRLASYLPINSASCSVQADRPLDPMDTIQSDKNFVSCEFEQKKSVHSSLKLELKGESLETFGRRFEDHVTFKGALAARLFSVFEQKYLKARSAYPLLAEILMCDPGGNACVEMYSLDQRLDNESPGALICSRNTELAKLSEPDTAPADDSVKKMILRQLKQKKRVLYGKIRCTAIQMK